MQLRKCIVIHNNDTYNSQFYIDIYTSFLYTFHTYRNTLKDGNKSNQYISDVYSVYVLLFLFKHYHRIAYHRNYHFYKFGTYLIPIRINTFDTTLR